MTLRPNFVVLVPAFLALAACAPDDGPTRRGGGGGAGTGAVEAGHTWALNPDAIRLGESSIASVEVLADRVVVPSDAEAELVSEIEDGTSILIAGANPFDTKKNPGFVRRVLTRNVIGEKTELMTEDVDVATVLRGTLSSAIDRPTLRAMDTGKGMVPAVTKEGLGLAGAGPAASGYGGFDFEQEFSWNMGKFTSPYPGAEAYGFDGKLTVTPKVHIAPFIDFDVDLDLDIGWHAPKIDLNRARVALGVEYDAKVDVEALVGVYIADGFIKQIVPNTPISYGMIGPIPYTIFLGVDLDCHYVMDAGISIHTVEPFHFYGTPTLGATYAKGNGWSMIDSSPFHYDGGKVDGGIANGWLPAGMKADGKGIPIKAKQTWECSVGPRLNIGIGATMSFFGKDLTTAIGVNARPAIRGAIELSACANAVWPAGGKPTLANLMGAGKVEASVDATVGAFAMVGGHSLARADYTIFREIIARGTFGSQACVQ